MATYQRYICAGALASVFAAGALCANAWAQSSTPPDPAQLIEALKEKGKTRGMPNVAEIEKRRSVIEALQRREKTRGLSVEENESPAVTLQEVQDDFEQASVDRPAEDIEIYFDYNSDTITIRAEPSLASLGKSLQSNELKNQSFVLAGYTDAKGSRDYNQELSERRALAVKKFLVDHFSIPEDELAIIGYGEDRLKFPDQPYAGENRRVQVVNMGQVTASK